MLNEKQVFVVIPFPPKDFACFSCLMIISSFPTLCFPGCGLGGQLRNGQIVVAV